MIKNNYTIIFDFDSTIVSIETLDYIIKSKIKDKKILDKIEDITNQGMNGKISLKTSIEERINLTKITLSDINLLRKKIINYLTNDIDKLLNKIKKVNKDTNFIIISGGFKAIIEDVAKYLKIDHYYGNNAILDKDKNIVGLEENILLYNQGKVKLIKDLQKEKIANENIIMIGDGYTDLEVYLENQDKTIFCGFGINVRREIVEKLSKHFFYSMKELDNFLMHILQKQN